MIVGNTLAVTTKTVIGLGKEQKNGTYRYCDIQITAEDKL